jgi:transcriptional regulator with XRE-family HTH domain
MEDMTAERKFGERVKELRNRRGWSQEKLADLMSAAGFPWRQTTTAKTEAADRPVRVSEVAALARIFAVPPAAMFDVGIEADTAYELHGITRAEAELERVQRRVQAQLDDLHLERIEVEVRQAQRRYVSEREGSDGGEHRPAP